MKLSRIRIPGGISYKEDKITIKKIKKLNENEKESRKINERERPSKRQSFEVRL